MQWLSACLLLAACSPASAPSPSPAADEFQTALPLPTIDTFDGITAIPDGQFLFISVTASQRCGAACNCPVVEAVQDPFTFSSEMLTLNWSGSNSPTDQDWASLRADSGAIGLYAFYNLSSGNLKTFSALPYDTPDKYFVVTGVDEDGSIAVKVGYGTTRVAPGEQIQQQNTTSPGGLCRILFTTTLRNFGFLRDGQVTLR